MAMIKPSLYLGGSMVGMARTISSLAFLATILLEGVPLAGSSRFEQVSTRRLGRNTLGEKVASLDVTMGRFGIPSDSEVLFESEGRCKGSVHPSLLPKRALMCNWVSNIRACMGVGPKDALLVGRGCRGQYCTLDLVPGPAECVLESYGLTVDVSDKALKKTCGLSAEDHDWLISGENPAWESEGCDESLPRGTSSKVWATCRNGKLGFHYRLDFTQSDMRMPKEVPYTCKNSPNCGGEWASSLVCYSQEKKSVTLQQTNGGDAVRRVPWGVVLLLGSWVLFGLLF